MAVPEAPESAKAFLKQMAVEMLFTPTVSVTIPEREPGKFPPPHDDYIFHHVHEVPKDFMKDL